MSADAVLEAFEAAWSSRDPTAFGAMCAPDVHYEDPFGGPLEGVRTLGAHAARLRTAFPDARVASTGARLTDGRFVAAPVRVAGTNTGELDGLPPTRRAVVVQAVLFCELTEAGDALLRVRAFCDRYEAALQLGLVPRAGSLGEKALLALQGFGLTPRR